MPAGHLLSVWGSVLSVEYLGFRVQGLAFSVQYLGFSVQRLVLRVKDSGFRVQGLRFRVSRDGERVGGGARVARGAARAVGLRHIGAQPLLLPHGDRVVARRTRRTRDLPGRREPPVLARLREKKNELMTSGRKLKASIEGSK